MGKGFEEFEPIFGRIKAEWENPNSNSLSSSLLPFLLHVQALDSSRLRIHVTDFHSTWEATRSVQQLEDLRDDVGIGGSWSEFVDYLIASLKSDNVKLVLGGIIGSAKSGGDHGATFAKLIAHKSKGMPLVTISLDRLMNSSANDAMASLSLELFEAFKSKHELVVKEQECSYQLTRRLSAEKEKNESIQNQLDVALFSKRQKLRALAASDKALPTATPIGNLDILPISDSHDSSGNPPMEVRPLSTKVGHRVVPAYRRAKVRGVLLDDTEDGGGN
ncbi:hypothetical protein BVC80_7513g1 [Macleaya cordata]|uniref:Uncharacterized protein n=1 Tax=Macleaya cordata TaxID=56857 RepID=A0A200Q8U6_MACCD|nr:hypothetical protein BVC80_7513g1 [Macleaya cordata]